MTDSFDREMQAALMADAEKLRALGDDVPDPIFADATEEDYCELCGAYIGEGSLIAAGENGLCVECEDDSAGPLTGTPNE